MILKLKILEGTGRVFAAKRHKRRVYRTNRFGKYYAFYEVLKALTSTGKIQNYPSQLAEIKQACKISTQTFYQYMRVCERLGLIKREGFNLLLTSHTKVHAWLNKHKPRAPKMKFIEFDYDTTKPEQKPQYFLKLAAIKEAEGYRELKVIHSINQNMHIKRILGVEQSSTQAVEQLQTLQQQTFERGYQAFGMTKDEYKTLHSINADTSLTARSIKNLFGFKTWLSAVYLKDILHARRMVNVVPRKLVSPLRMRKGKEYKAQGFDQETGSTYWQLPDKINLMVPFKVVAGDPITTAKAF